MEHNNEIEEPKPARREPWIKGKLIGVKPPLRPSQVWLIRTKRQMRDRKRDLALFNLAIDSFVAVTSSRSALMTSLQAVMRWTEQQSHDCNNLLRHDELR